MGFENNLRTEIEKIKIIDTHEHIEPEDERIKREASFFLWLPNYTAEDLVSSGMPVTPALMEKVKNRSFMPFEETWEMIGPYWEHVRTTGYGKALLIAAKDLYGVEDINKNTYLKLSEKMANANKKGLYKHVLKDRAGIDISVQPEDLNAFNRLDREFFIPVMYIDGFISAADKNSTEGLGRAFGKTVNSIDDIIGIMELAVDKAIQEKSPAAKCSVAYGRTLKFGDTDSDTAKSIFNKIMEGKGLEPKPSLDSSAQRTHSVNPDESGSYVAKPFQDYLMHRMLEILQKKNMPLQVHTGIQAGNGNRVTNSKPTHLTNLFFRYPKLKFDIFHAGYPYSSELAVLAKNFPNVYADMCWMYIISPTASKRILHEWIDTIPNNKIFGFGGDYCFVEGAYAHSVMARKIIYQVLIEKWKKGYFTEEECMMLARKMLRDNPANFFKINN